MQNIAPTRAIFRRSRRLLQIAFVLGTAGLFAVTVGLGLYVFPLVTDASQSAGLFRFLRGLVLFGGVGLIFVAFALALRALTWRTENDLAKATASMLAPHFDKRFIFIRNINKLRIGYIDAVLVGPPGVLVLRLLDWEGTYLGEANGWLKAGSGKNWVPTRTNPAKETVEDIQKVRLYLQDYGMEDIPVFGIIVFMKPDPICKLMLKEPVVPATHLSSLHARLGEFYLLKDRIDNATVADIVKRLYDE